MFETYLLKYIWFAASPIFIEYVLQHNVRGAVSMANSGPDTNASQFFITYDKQPQLDLKYTLFAK